MMNPVFIVGLPRSASKWVMNALNTYTECCVTHEMHILRLWRCGNTTTIRRVARTGDLDGNKVEALRDLVLSGQLIGCFWRLRDHEYTVHRLEPAELRSALSQVEDGCTMLRAMMEAQRHHYGKWRAGARHPVHFIYLGTLLRWFPEARVVFLTRDIAEIARSWRAKRVPHNANPLYRALWNAGITTHSYLNGLLAGPVLRRWRRDQRVLEVRYHQLVKNPESTFRRICKHLHVLFDSRMADASYVYDSAFDPSANEVPPYPVVWTPPVTED